MLAAPLSGVVRVEERPRVATIARGRHRRALDTTRPERADAARVERARELGMATGAEWRRRAGRTIMIITVTIAMSRASPPDTNRTWSEIQSGNEEHSFRSTVAVVESGSSEVEFNGRVVVRAMG